MTKRLVALFLVLLLSIESFGAVVSDNDGSAFITKAEFDSLKNNFQSQIDQYNTSIDSKIDGAIASYLAGIKTDKVVTLDLPLKGWKSVTAIGNTTPTNSWKMMDIDLQHIVFGLNTHPTSGTWHACWWLNATAKYSRTGTQLRLVCDAGTEGTSYPTYVVWIGQAKDYYEKLTATLMEENISANAWTEAYPGEMMTSDGFHWCNITRLNTGYYSTLSSTSNRCWTPRFYYNDEIDSKDGYRVPSSVRSFVAESMIEVRDYSTGNYNYPHIIMYDDRTFPYFSDPDWKRSFRQANGGYWSREELKSSATLNSKWAGYEGDNSTQNSRKATNNNWTGPKSCSNYWSGNYLSSDTGALVSIGIVNKQYKSSYIYQTSAENVFLQDVDGTAFTTGQLNLLNGFPIFAGKQGDTFKWQPVFNNLKQSGSSTSAWEVDIEFSTKPFLAGQSISSGGVIIRNKNSTSDWTTTVNKTANIEFELPIDGIVYCKWWPSNSSVASSYSWEINLNLDNCGTYTRIQSENN